MTFVEDQESVQNALRQYIPPETKQFEQPRLEDTCQLYRLYGRVLRDLEDVTAVLDTVAAYEEQTKAVAQAKFVSELLGQMQYLLVARRKLIFTISALLDRDTIPDYYSLSLALGPTEKSLLESVRSPFLMQLRDNILTELQTLNKLIQTQTAIANLDFKQSLFLLYLSNSELQSWRYKYVSPVDMTPLEGGFLSWMRNFLSALASKLCFYFQNSFISSLPSLNENIPKERNFIEMIKNLTESAKCKSFYLVNVSPPKKNASELQVRNTHTNQLKCEIIWTYPGPEADEWETIITNINDSQEYLNKFSLKTIFFSDNSKQIEYFLSKAENNLFAVACFHADGGSETNPIALQFFDNLTAKLRFW